MESNRSLSMSRATKPLAKLERLMADMEIDHPYYHNETCYCVELNEAIEQAKLELNAAEDKYQTLATAIWREARKKGID